MPRSNSGGELLQYLTSVLKYTIKPAGASTLTSEAVTVDMADTDVVSITGVAAADVLTVSGSGGMELMEVTSAASANIVWKNPLQVAQNSGAAVVEMVAVNLNHIAEAGIKFGGSLTLTTIKAATSRVAIAFFPSAAEFTFEIPTLGWNNLSLLAAFGAPETENGVGSAADPYAAAIHSGNVATEATTCFRCLGALHDGRIVQLDICDATIEVNVNATMGAPNPEGFVLAGKATTFIQRIWT